MSVSYISAAFVNHGAEWRPGNVDPDEQAESLEELAEELRAVAIGGQPVLAVFESEDEWFALVRVDGDEDPRVFVSDDDAVRHSVLSGVLTDEEGEDLRYGGHYRGQTATEEDDLSSGDASDPAEQPDVDATALADGDAGEDDEESEDSGGSSAWGGDPSILSDLGVGEAELVRLVAENPDDPATVLDEIGEKVGFADLLETLG